MASKASSKREVEEWEKPVGLTSEWAIEISDNDNDTYAGSTTEAARSGESAAEMGMDPGNPPDADKSMNETNGTGGRDGTSIVASNSKPHVTSALSTHPSPIASTRNCQDTGKNGGETTSDKVCVQATDLKGDDSGMTNRASCGRISCDGKNQTEPKANPFAAFAFDRGKEESMYFGASGDIRESGYERKGGKGVTGSDTSKFREEQEHRVKAQKGHQSRKRRKKCTSSEYVPIAKMPSEERIKIRSKWQSFGDPGADLEVRRFQVLVAARLHAQSREPIVRAAMDNLREYFASSPTSNTKKEDDTVDSGKGLCVETLSEADPEKIKPMISSVLFANVKARHIVQVAKEIKTRFRGQVPETETCLKQLTGIGPTLSDILSFCNSRASYDETDEVI